MAWNTSSDELHIAGSPSSNTNVLTKRHVLTEVTKLYDPLRLLTPVTFNGKLFLQELCKSHLTWDEPLPTKQRYEWLRVIDVLRQIPTVKIPRCPTSVNESCTYQVHVFCDASMKSYATAVYLRSARDSDITSTLVFSKMRLAPLRANSANPKPKKGTQITMPRLELLGSVIGVRAATFVSDQLNLPISKRFVWIDSQCVLHWLRTTKPLSLFVDNRIAEMRKQSNITFCYVPTSQNPADLATRGRTVPQLRTSTLWWHGPTWLRSPEDCWPHSNMPDLTPAILQNVQEETRGPTVLHEMPNAVTISTITEGDPPLASPFSIDESRFSSFRKLLRVTSWVLKFLTLRIWQRLPNTVRTTLQRKHRLLTALFDGSSEHTHPNCADLRKARLLWEYTLQRRRFPDVIRTIQMGRQHNLERQLGLQFDEHGLLRCHGRFEHASISPVTKTPKLLPRQEPYTRLLIQDNSKPRGSWRLARIETLHTGTDHQLRSATVRLPSRRTLTRPLNHLFPLEIPGSTDEKEPQVSVSQPSDEDTDGRSVSVDTPRPTRSAATQARARMTEWLREDPVTLLFTVPRSVP